MQIIVTGALGSGVTALAAGLAALGASAGDGAASAAGHDGAWNGCHPAVDDALDDVLTELGMSWPFADASLALATLDPASAERVGARLTEVFAALGDGLVADARWAHVLPLALAAAPDAVVVVATRAPGRTARWLDEQRATPLAAGFAAWEVHTARALRGARSGRLVVVDMDDWRARPEASARRLVERLTALGVDGLALPDELPPLPHPEDDGVDVALLESGYATTGWATLRRALDDAEPTRASPLALDALRSFALLLDGERRRRDAKTSTSSTDDDATLRRLHAQAREHGLATHERDLARRRLAALEEQLAVLRERLAAAQRDLDASRTAHGKLRGRVHELSSHVTDLVNDTRRREAALRTRLANALSKLKLVAPRVREMRSAAKRAHEHEYEIYRLRTRVLKKEEAIQTLRRWLASTNASVPLLPGAWKDRLRFIRWNRSVTDEDIRPLPKPLDELREDSEAKRARDEKRHRDVERELDRLRRELDASVHHGVVSEVPVAKVGNVLGEVGQPLRVAVARHGPRRRPARASHQAKPRSLVVYTAVSGGYDSLKRPEHLPHDCDFVCFTDDPGLRSDVWQMRPFDVYHVDPTRMARYVKTHPHVYFPEHEHSIWIDGNLLVQGDLRPFLDALDDEHPFAAFVHPHRDCIYAEADEIVARGGLDDERIVRRQVEAARAEGHPEQHGLIETNVLVRRHNDPRVVALMNAWWKEIDNGSKRDQLSLPVVARRAGFEIAPLAAHGTSVRNHHALQRYRHGTEGVVA